MRSGTHFRLSATRDVAHNQNAVRLIIDLLGAGAQLDREYTAVHPPANRLPFDFGTRVCLIGQHATDVRGGDEIMDGTPQQAVFGDAEESLHCRIDGLNSFRIIECDDPVGHRIEDGHEPKLALAEPEKRPAPLADHRSQKQGGDC